jgi:hypothetical protein
LHTILNYFGDGNSLDFYLGDKMKDLKFRFWVNQQNDIKGNKVRDGYMIQVDGKNSAVIGNIHEGGTQ